MRGSVGASKMRSGGPCSRIRPSCEEAHPVGDLAGEAHLVGGDQHRHAVALELAHDVEHLADELGIERRRDLVEQHDLGVHRQRPGDRDALLLTARELIGVGVGLVGQAEPVEQLERRRVGAAPRRALSTLRGAERDVRRRPSCAGTG